MAATVLFVPAGAIAIKCDGDEDTDTQTGIAHRCNSYNVCKQFHEDPVTRSASEELRVGAGLLVNSVVPIEGRRMLRENQQRKCAKYRSGFAQFERMDEFISISYPDLKKIHVPLIDLYQAH